MIDELALNKSVRDTINKIVNNADYKVIMDEQNAPRPKDPYCTVHITRILTDSLEQWTEENTENNQVISKTEAMRRIMVSLKFYYGVPYNTASLVRQGLMRRSITSFLSTQKLGLLTRSAIRNETAQLENGFEERVGFDVFFSFVEKDSEVIGTIGEAQITGNYQYAGNSIPVSIEIKQ